VQVVGSSANQPQVSGSSNRHRPRVIETRRGVFKANDAKVLLEKARSCTHGGRGPFRRGPVRDRSGRVM